MFLICLSDVGEHSEFKQPNYPLTVTDVLTIILLGASRNSSESLVTSLHLGFLSILVILVFLKFFMGKRKKKKKTHAHCNLCLIPLMLLNIPSVSVDVTHVPRARKTSSSFQGLLSSDSITTETHKYQMENRNLCALTLICCSGSTITNCKICLNSAHRVNLSSTIMTACFQITEGTHLGPSYSSP